MIKSMTGFGRHKAVIGGRDILCEVKSVNSRYLDLNIKLPRIYAPLEDGVKQLASRYITRGKLDIYISVDNISGDSVNLSVNEEYLEGYLKLLGEIKKRYSIEGEVSLPMLAGKSEIFIARKADEDMDQVWQAVSAVASEAFESFLKMRATEGEKLKNDISENLAELEKFAAEIKKRAPEAIKASYEKIKARVTELMGAVPVDEARLLTECAVFADKTDINEELARLDSHFSQFKAILDEEVPVGRKLDFLTQELNREVNTIGSKANDNSVAKLVIDAKCAIERIREQIQNIE